MTANTKFARLTFIVLLTALLPLLVVVTGCADGGSSSTPGAGDSDGDGLSDIEETEGWLLLVDTSGFAKPGAQTGETQHLEERRVTSDPKKADTDGDGLDDGAERRSQADPRRSDTDGDGLDDLAEVEMYATSPNAVDSDGDARGDDGANSPNSRLFDGAEVDIHSSPLLADTDADGISDYREIVDGGSHPAISDVPQIELNLVDAPSVTLNAVEATETTEGLESVSAVLRGTSSSSSSTDSYTNETVLGFRESISNTSEVSASLSPTDWGVSASNSTTVEFEATQTFSSSATHSTTRESAQMAQSSFEEAVSAEMSTSRRYEGGTIRVNLGIANKSAGITVRVADVTIIAKRYDAKSGQMVAVAELSAVNPIDDNIAAGDRIEAIFENTSVATDDVKAILADPRALSFEIGRYAMSRIDSLGQPTADYAALAENMTRQCGLVVIDYGDGQVERYSVATNLLRDAQGRPRGEALGEVLQLIGAADDVVTERNAETGTLTLAGLGGRTNDFRPGQPGNKFWVVLAKDQTVDLNDIVLAQGNRITFAFVRDDDGDGLFNREEKVLGTDPNNVDSDGDTLCDGDVRIGSCIGDELSLGTNPANPDTDGDDLDDAVDPEPLVNANTGGPTGGTIPTTGLMAYWPISANDGLVDLGPMSWNTEHRCSTDPINDRAGDFGGALDFANHGPSTRCYAATEGLVLPETFTMSVWIRRSQTQTSHGFIAGQYGRAWLTSPQQSGAVSGHIGLPYRDNGITVTSEALPSGLSEWTHVALTLGNDGAGGRLKLYVDGELVDDAIAETGALANRIEDTPCPDTFNFGGADWVCRDNRNEFSGGFDDVRVYDRELNSTQIRALAAEVPE